MRFLGGLFSESDGKPSSSRLTAFLTVLFALGWVTYLVVCHKALPDLSGLTLFVPAVVAATYGLNKLPAMIDAAKTENK